MLKMIKSNRNMKTLKKLAEKTKKPLRELPGIAITKIQEKFGREQL